MVILKLAITEHGAHASAQLFNRGKSSDVLTQCGYYVMLLACVTSMIPYGDIIIFTGKFFGAFTVLYILLV